MALADVRWTLALKWLREASCLVAAHQPVPPAPMILVTIGKLLVYASGQVLCGRCPPQRAGQGHPGLHLLPVPLEYREPCTHMSLWQQALDKFNEAAASISA